MSGFKFFWNTHKWVGITVAIIFINTAVTGFLLLVKKDYAWIQPAEIRGVEANLLTVSFDQILEAAKRRPELEINSWEDVDRLDVRPGKGMVKIRANNFWEAQVDLSTGELLQTAYRRSDLIEMIHDGSFYGDWVHGWVMPVVACALFFMVCSGLYLWFEPIFRRRRRKPRAERLAERAAANATSDAVRPVVSQKSR